jgi:hypothetical protein
MVDQQRFKLIRNPDSEKTTKQDHCLGTIDSDSHTIDYINPVTSVQLKVIENQLLRNHTLLANRLKVSK